MLRDVAEGIAEYVRKDAVLSGVRGFTVVVEDKADFGNEISLAIGRLGVCVTIAVTGFVRVQQSPIPQGVVRFQISCWENPTLNREDLSDMTAQAVAERLVAILHWHKFPFTVGQFLFVDFERDDVPEANVVRMNFEVNTVLGYEERICRETQQPTNHRSE